MKHGAKYVAELYNILPADRANHIAVSMYAMYLNGAKWCATGVGVGCLTVAALCAAMESYYGHHN